MNPDTTPTPRTDEQIWTAEFHHKLCDVVDKEFSRQLERELTEKNNEVARLREENENQRETLQSFVLVSPIEAERMEKLEQDYDRLEEELKERIETQNTFAMALLEKPEREVARLRELLERLCDSVAENWDEGIANYFREEANK